MWYVSRMSAYSTNKDNLALPLLCPDYFILSITYQLQGLCFGLSLWFTGFIMLSVTILLSSSTSYHFSGSSLIFSWSFYFSGRVFSYFTYSVTSAFLSFSINGLLMVKYEMYGPSIMTLTYCFTAYSSLLWNSHDIGQYTTDEPYSQFSDPS